MTDDGTGVFISDAAPLTPNDVDGSHTDFQGEDVFLLRDGTVKLISTGPASFGGPGPLAPTALFRAATPDGSEVIFETVEALTADDSDFKKDIYRRIRRHRADDPCVGSQHPDHRRPRRRHP